MNRYKSALSDIMCCVPYGKLKEQEEILKELVEKATPKKHGKKYMELKGFIYYNCVCPNCGKAICFETQRDHHCLKYKE